MKKIFYFFLLVALILGSQSVFGQEADHEKVVTESFQKVIKGALWSKRPEAKEVYEGRTPPGVDEVITLETDYFVLFAAGEHNNLDINYIYFPKGQKIYKKNNDYFAAYCGNRIASWRPIEKEKIKIVVQQASDSTKTQKQENTLVDYGNQEKIKAAAKAYADSIAALNAKAKENATPKTKKSKEDKTWVGNNLWVIPTGLAFIGGTIWAIDELSKDNPIILVQEEEFNPVDALPQAKKLKEVKISIPLLFFK